MKVLFDSAVPCALAHGGMQIQIDQTMAALRGLGVAVEPLRWWDEHQTGDILHYFGRVPYLFVQLAHQKGMKVVFSDFLGSLASRSPSRIQAQRLIIRALRGILTPQRASGLSWEMYRSADACIALNPYEARLMSSVFNAPTEKVHVIANGVEEIFFKSAPVPRGKWLVCTATIRDIKRNLEMAAAAVRAQTPLWLIGKPYSLSDPYAQRFLDFAQRHPEWVRYEGAIEDREKMARVYREARGFVLLSAYESLSLSALEAAACQCPMLLSDLPWARSTFQDTVQYCPVGSENQTAAVLRKFYDAAPGLKPPDLPMTWTQVAQQLAGIYRGVLAD